MRVNKDGRTAHVFLEKIELEHLLQKLGTDSFLYDYFHKAYEEIFK